MENKLKNIQIKLVIYLVTACLALASSAPAESSEDDTNSQEIGNAGIVASKPNYAFEDQWNVRLEASFVSQRLAERKNETFVLLNKYLSGIQTQIDVNYGPIGFYAALTSLLNKNDRKTDFRLNHKIHLRESGVFFEFKPFPDKDSKELRGLAFGLNLGVQDSSEEYTISDHLQSHRFNVSGKGLKAGGFVRFYTIADIYYVLRIEQSVINVNHQNLNRNDRNHFNYKSFGVGYAF